jgi:hypothetical protein
MYKTKEVRWFFKNENRSIENWFKNLEFDPLEQREDFYLHLQKEEVGVKLREENIEVKHRAGTRSRGCAGEQAWGYFENWIKWSFNAGADPQILSEITDGKGESWLSVVKERKSAKLTLENDEIAIKSPTDELEYGCQIEYTKIRLLGESWYTFALEWFGETCMEVNSSLATEVLGDTRLAMKQSMGYPAFLYKLQNSKQRMLLAPS